MLLGATSYVASIVLFGRRPTWPAMPRPWAARAFAALAFLSLPFLDIRDENLSDAAIGAVVFVAIAGAVTSLFVQRPTTA